MVRCRVSAGRAHGQGWHITPSPLWSDMASPHIGLRRVEMGGRLALMGGLLGTRNADTCMGFARVSRGFYRKLEREFVRFNVGHGVLNAFQRGLSTVVCRIKEG